MLEGQTSGLGGFREGFFCCFFPPPVMSVGGAGLSGQALELLGSMGW